MRFSSIAAIALALASLPLVAQNQSEASFGVASIQGLSAIPSQVNRPSACPVDMRAQHLAYGDMVKTGDAAPAPKGPGQRLQLTLGSAAARQIVRATMTVHGLSPKSRVWRATPAQGASSDTVRTLTVPFSRGASGIATAEIWLPGFSAVEAIDLKSVVYTDGSTWSLADGATCRIAPDPFMLIAGH